MRSVVIGCGRMGARHVEALLGIGCDVVGIYDINKETASSVAQKYGLTTDRVFETISDLLELSDVGLCVIATTAPSHKQYIELAIKAGVRKILCEKPIATSLADCNDLISLANSNKVEIAVNHQMMYLDQYTAPKALLNSDDFGGLESISVSAGNFGMSMNGVHYIEMARFMFDTEPKKITAWFDDNELANPRGAEFKDKSGSFRLQMKNGKRFYLDASATQGHGIVVTYCAKYGQIVIDELLGTMYIVRRNLSDVGLPTTRYGQPSITETQVIKGVDVITSTQAVLKALIAGKTYPTLENAVLAVQTLIAGYISNESGNIAIEITNSNLPINRVFPWA